MSLKSRILFLLTAAFVAGPSWACAQAGTDGASDAKSELDALRQRVAALEAALSERDARLALLTQVSAVVAQAPRAPVVSAAVPAKTMSRNAGLSETGTAPSSSIPLAKALSVATAARFLVPGASVLTVRPTGSMRPVFDERAVLLTEPARFEDLKVGDIVTYRHPDHGMPVVHRIAEKHGDRFWAKGDGNVRMDDIYVTRDNYQGRVFGIVYAADAPPSVEKKH